MAQEEVYTTVKKHQRSNPVNPGKHWVRKHPRFIGYRDPEEIKLLGASSIADIKGVGGVSSEILAAHGYLTLEDAERLAQDPAAQQELIQAGLRPHTMEQIIKTTGDTPQREMIQEKPKPKSVYQIKMEIIADLEKNQTLSPEMEKKIQSDPNYAYALEVAMREGKIIQSASGDLKLKKTSSLYEQMEEERKKAKEEKIKRQQRQKEIRQELTRKQELEAQTKKEREQTLLKEKKEEILERLKQDVDYRNTIYELRNRDPTYEKAVQELIKEGKLEESEASGFVRLKENKEYTKNEIIKLLENQTAIFNDSERIWNELKDRKDIHVYQHTIHTILSELEQEGKIQTETHYDSSSDTLRTNVFLIKDGEKIKKNFEKQIDLAQNFSDLRKIRSEIRGEYRTERYRHRLIERIEKREKAMKKQETTDWFNKHFDTEREKGVWDRFKDVFIYGSRWERDPKDTIQEGSEKNFIMSPTREVALVLPGMKHPLTIKKEDTIEIVPKKTLQKSKLEAHERVFASYSPELIWGSYRVLGQKGTKFYIPKDKMGPMYMEKDGIRMYVAPRLADDSEKWSTEQENQWYREQVQQFLKEKPDYEKGGVKKKQTK